MNNRMLDRLFKVYPFTNKNLDKYYYRDVRIRQLTLYLHNASWDEEKVDTLLEFIRYIEKIGVKDFGFLCDLAATKRLDKFVDVINDVVKVRL